MILLLNFTFIVFWRFLDLPHFNDSEFKKQDLSKSFKHFCKLVEVVLTKILKIPDSRFSDLDADNRLVLAFFKIELWNFQDKLDLWFREASQNLSSFRQLFFHSFQGGIKGKMLKNCQNYTSVFSIFPLVPPWKLWQKSCLNELKFWEASRKLLVQTLEKFIPFFSSTSCKFLKINLLIWSFVNSVVVAPRLFP